MRHVCAKSPYRRYPNPNPINPLTKSAPQSSRLGPRACQTLPRPVARGLARPAIRSGGGSGWSGRNPEPDPAGSLAEGMRGRAGWKAGRPRGRGGDPHRSRRWSLPSLPAVCRRTPRQQRGPRSAHVEARPRGASDVRRNGIFSTHRADARRSAHAPNRRRSGARAVSVRDDQWRVRTRNNSAHPRAGGDPVLS